jgi:hypothetical protein
MAAIERHRCGARVRRMADREGFEPSVRFTAHTLSKRAHSTTLPSVLCWSRAAFAGAREAARSL